MRILVTGFDPFGDDTVNPSWQAVKRLPDRIAGADIIRLEIPTVFGRSLEMIEKAICDTGPDAVISVGQAGGRPDITVERIAVNCIDCRIADNEGTELHDVKIREDGPDAYFASLPYRSVTQKILEAGIPASVSDTAGTFVCNYVMYGVRDLCARKYPDIISGFIHVPYLPSQAAEKGGVSSMSLDQIAAGLSAACEAAAEYLKERA